MKELILIKLGDDNRPATQKDIDNLRKDIKKAIKKGKSIMITHHAVSIEKVLFKDK